MNIQVIKVKILTGWGFSSIGDPFTYHLVERIPDGFYAKENGSFSKLKEGSAAFTSYYAAESFCEDHGWIVEE